MKTIRLYGDIAKQFKHEWRLDVTTPSEALRAINANRPGFCVEADKGNYIALLVNEKADINDMNAARQVTAESGLDRWDNEVLMVVPKIEGEVTIAGVISLGTALGTTVAPATAAVIAFVANLAISIAISSVAAVIASAVQGDGPEEPPENKPSYLFNGVVNTTRQGHRIPVLYGGPLLVGSMVLSSRVNTKDIEV